MQPMQFLYPSFLFALAALAIPIVIHLFHFRRYKKIVFSDLRFLKQLQEENKSKRKLKDILVLISRLFALSFLVLAFAQPFIPGNHTLISNTRKVVSLFIDNSFSMNQEGQEGILLETAKTKARGIINGYGNDAQYQIHTMDVHGKQGKLLSKSLALELIDEISISNQTVDYSTLFSRQKTGFENAGNAQKIQYVLSDFQSASFLPTPIAIDSSIKLHLIPLESNTNRNISIDSLWFTTPSIQLNTPVTIKVRIHNYSDENLEHIPVTLTINGQQKGLQNVDIAAGRYNDIAFSYTPINENYHQGYIQLVDNPISFDNTFHFVFKPVSNYALSFINGAQQNAYLTKLFEGDNLYTLNQFPQTQINFNRFKEQQMILLNEPIAISSGLSQELLKYIAEGGQLCIVPGQDKAGIESLNQLLLGLGMPSLGSPQNQRQLVTDLNFQDPLFRNVFQQIPSNMELPSVEKYYSLETNGQNRGNALMKLANGNPFIWQANYKKGRIILLSTPIDIKWTNFHQLALFVPFMIKLANGKPQSEMAYSVIGEKTWINLEPSLNNNKLIRFWGNKVELTFESNLRQGKNALFMDQTIPVAGIFNLAQSGEKIPRQLIAFNFSRKESNPVCFKTEELEKLIAKWPGADISDESASVLQNSIQNSLNGTPLWRYCIGLTLLFVLIEILLLRLLK